MLEDVRTCLIFDHFDPLTRVMFALTNRKHLAFVRAHVRFTKIALSISPMIKAKEIEVPLSFYLGALGSRAVLDFVDDNGWRFDFDKVVETALAHGHGDLCSTFKWVKYAYHEDTFPQYRTYSSKLSSRRAGYLVGKSCSRGLLELLRKKRLDLHEDELLTGAILSGRVEWVDAILPPLSALPSLTVFKLADYKSTIRKAAALAVSLGKFNVVDFLLQNRGLRLTLPAPNATPSPSDVVIPIPPYALMFGIRTPEVLHDYIRYIEGKGLDIDYVKLVQYQVLNPAEQVLLEILQGELRVIDRYFADIDDLKRLIRRALSCYCITAVQLLVPLRPPLALVRIGRHLSYHLTDPNEDEEQDREGRRYETTERPRLQSGIVLSASEVDFFGEVK